MVVRETSSDFIYTYLETEEEHKEQQWGMLTYCFGII